jgi:hypothetical protein
LPISAIGGKSFDREALARLEDAMSNILFYIMPWSKRCGTVAALAAAGLGCGCIADFKNSVMPHYTWDFYKIRADATPREQAFKECERLAKKRNRFVADNIIRGYEFAGDVLTCMKWEGWGQSTNSVTFHPIRRVEP